MSLFDPLRPYIGLLKAGLFLACVIAAFAYGCQQGRAAGERAVRASELRQAQADTEQALADGREIKAAAARYRQQAEAQAAIAEQHIKDLTNAKDRADRTAADLRNGAIRLRRQWQGCEARLSAGNAAADPGEPDGDTHDRAASAGRIVRAAAECDAQVKGLQAILIEERK